MAVEKLSTKTILNKNLSHSPPSLLKNLHVVLHNIRSLYNVGSVFRSADAFGAGRIILSGYTPTPPRQEITKTAIGAEEHVKWEYIENFDSYHQQIKRAGYTTMGIEQTTQSQSLVNFDPNEKETGKFSIIFGNEVTGIDDDILNYIDFFVELPQFGHKHSLNISVTVGIVLYSLLQKS